MTIQNHYFDDKIDPARPYTGHSSEAMPGTVAPLNALRGETPDTSVTGFWPCEENGAWVQREDHRGEEGWVGEEWQKIKFIGPLPEGWSETPPPAPPLTPEEQAAAEYAAAKFEADTVLTARMQRQLVQAEEFTASEFTLFARAGLFPVWTPGTEYVKGERLVYEGIVYEVQQPVTAQEHQPPGTEYVKGERLVYEGIVYEVQQPVTAQEHQPPGSEGMLAVYRPLSVDADSGDEPDGSLENPFAYLHGMDVYTGRYYTFEDKLYLAKADMIPCVWNPGTAGLWQWEEIV